MHTCWINTIYWLAIEAALILADACFEFQWVTKFRTTLDLFISCVGDYITRDVMKCALMILGRNLNRCTDIHIEMNDICGHRFNSHQLPVAMCTPTTYHTYTLGHCNALAGNVTPQSCIATHQLGLNLGLNN